MMNVKPVQLGKNITRMSFARIGEALDMPNLIEVQKDSYNWFLKEGLRAVFKDVSPITDYQGKLSLEFLDYRLDDTPKYTIAECKERDATYSTRMHVNVRLINHETGEIKEQEVYMGDFPLMTDAGTFVINGAERVIVSQLVRSPGVYFDMMRDNAGKRLFTSQIIPNRGAWLEYDTDSNDYYNVRIDKNRKLPITTFIRALLRIRDDVTVEQIKDDGDYSIALTSYRGTNAEIYELFGRDHYLVKTAENKDIVTRGLQDGQTVTGEMTGEEALLEVYKKLRPGEPPTLESAIKHMIQLLFDAQRYDLSRVGRYKYNKKLALAPRLSGHILSRPLANPMTGEVVAEAGEVISREKAHLLEDMGIDAAWITVHEPDDTEKEVEVKVMSNGMVNIARFIAVSDEAGSFDTSILAGIDWEALGVNEDVRFEVLKEILDSCSTKEEVEEAVRQRVDDLIPKYVRKYDIFASINYMSNLLYDVGHTDDIDHLGNRRIRSVGELLQNQFRIGFSRMERVIHERMQNQNDDCTPQSLINIRPVVASVKEFFGSSPLSQFMDQTNPLAELTHKRRLSALGPGGLSRDRAGFEVRDVHYSHYGRMCPVETPEGPNIGLISYLATFARINQYGFVQAPYRKVDKETGVVTNEVVYMTADVEDEYVVAQANTPLDENNRFATKRVTVRHRDVIKEVAPSDVDYMDVSPKMVVSVATAMIPFLDHDDTNRALMGANMQRQAVPLIKTENACVATGMEYKAGIDSGTVLLSKHDGVVEKVDADGAVIRTDSGEQVTYPFIKFLRSNQSTCINQRPVVNKGDRVKVGDVIADGPATANGEIALGKNALIGFMTWEGYNYEDAVLLNEKMVRNDVYTSIHIEEYETEARDTKLGPEEITRDIPNVGDDMLKELDERGIIRIGAEVHSGDILVGKVTPKGEAELGAEEKLLRAIFGEKAREVRDTSLRVPHGEYGIIVDVKVFTRENCDELSAGVHQVVRCYIAQKRKISVGDKMAGRHGNKGVVSRILPQEDMPFLPDGRPLDIVLNPLGVPSRMNIGQVLEVHLGRAAMSLGWNVMTPVFDGAQEEDIREALRMAAEKDPRSFLPVPNDTRVEHVPFQGPETGKTILYDGRTGEAFDNPVTVGYMYYLKLHHLVDDKIHARSTGPYSLVTQQPLGGKAQFGGQRFGEMEVWALEAYGAAYTLQEILTVKSDDVVGRVKTFEAIVKGQNVPMPGIPESFKVLIKELQSLALDIRVLDKDNKEIDLRQTFDDEDYVPSDTPLPADMETSADENEMNNSGYNVQSADDEFDTPEEEPDDSLFLGGKDSVADDFDADDIGDDSDFGGFSSHSGLDYEDPMSDQ